MTTGAVSLLFISLFTAFSMVFGTHIIVERMSESMQPPQKKKNLIVITGGNLVAYFKDEAEVHGEKYLALKKPTEKGCHHLVALLSFFQ